MSWITDLAGKAENLLNRLDSDAAEALNKSRRNSISTKQHSVSEGNYSKSGSVLQSSSSVPNNLNNYGTALINTGGETATSAGSGSGKSLGGNSSSLTSSPKAGGNKSRSSRRKKESSHDSCLIDFLNSPIQPEEAQQQDQQQLQNVQSYQDSVNQTQRTVDIMSSSLISSVGHSRQSSMSSVSSFAALSGRDTPGYATVDIETGSTGSGSGGSGNTDVAYVTVDTPTDVNISAPPSEGSSGGSSVGPSPLLGNDSESIMLRKEVASLNQEMSQVLRRAKDAEKEVQQLRTALSNSSSQQSTSERILRDMQQHIQDQQESLAAKDSQLAILRIRLQESDTYLESKSKKVEEFEKENQRLIQGVNESSGLHSHTIHTLEQRLEEVQGALGREKQLHINSQQDLTERISKKEQELQLLTTGLTEASRRFEEEKTKSQQLNSQMSSLRTELTTSRNELTEYKAKAGRILQSKEKLISSLKEGRLAEDPESQETSELLKEELEQIRQERDLLREELDEANDRCKQLRAEIQEIEDQAGDESRSAASQIQQFEEELKQEKVRKAELEKECQQNKQESRCATEELTKQKVNLSSRIQERDQQIERLRKQIAHKQSSSSSQAELEQRIHALTESLIHKQTTIETLNTEKHSLVMQMERLQKNYDDSQQMLNRDPPLPYQQEEVRNRVPTYMVESPFDGGITLRVKRAYTTLDKFSVRLGVFLRRYPIARVFVILYMMLLHVWVMIVLLTYTPEIHGPEYHHKPAGTLPHEK